MERVAIVGCSIQLDFVLAKERVLAAEVGQADPTDGPDGDLPLAIWRQSDNVDRRSIPGAELAPRFDERPGIHHRASTLRHNIPPPDFGA